jgi:hypothetical protein
MRAHAVATAAAVMLLAAGCAPVEVQRARAALEQGRRYTEWLYRDQHQWLWQRMTPELRGLFENPGEVRAFTAMLAGLGSEQDVLEETVKELEAVDDGEVERVYGRTAVFSRATSPVLIQWVLTRDGLVSGLAVQPVEQSKLTLGEIE